MKENEIRPTELLNRYLELSAQDAKEYFDDCCQSIIPCVGCGENDLEFQFKKNQFPYSLCNNCGSLFQSPRPPIEAFEAFYRKSESSRFWAESFFPAVAEARREKIFKPRVSRLYELCKTKGVSVKKIIDVGAGSGIFLDEWRKLDTDVNAVAIEPSKLMAEKCRNNNFEVIENIVENVKGYDNFADLVVCFEVLEHVYEPLPFILTLKKLVRPGGYLFISTLCVDGFDIQVLWESSKSVSPPHHINFLSITGFETLFARAGLNDIDISTPGQLDVDIVRNTLMESPELRSQHRFLGNLVKEEELGPVFQDFLVKNKLSSHAWIISKKPDQREKETRNE